MTMISILMALIALENYVSVWVYVISGKEHCFHVLLEILALALIDSSLHFDFLGISMIAELATFTAIIYIYVIVL